MDSSTKSFPGFFELLKWALSTYKKNAKIFISIGLVLVIVGLINPLARVIFDSTTGSGQILIGLIGIVASIAAVIVQLLGQIGTLTTIRDIDSGQTVPPVKQIYKNAMPLFWGYIWVSLIVFAISAGSVIFFVIPALILGIYLAFTIYSYILDGRKGLKALMTSMHYVDNYWWQVFAYIICFSLITVAISMIFLGVFFTLLIASGGGISNAATFQTAHPIIILLWSPVVSFCTTCVVIPIGFLFSYSMFKFLKQQKPEPNFDDAESKNRRILFIVFGVIGICVGLGLLLIPFLLIILAAALHSPGFTATTTQTSSIIDAMRGLF